MNVEPITYGELDALSSWVADIRASEESIEILKGLRDRLISGGVLKPVRSKIRYRGMHSISPKVIIDILKGKPFTFTARSAIQSWTRDKRVALSISVIGYNETGIVLATKISKKNTVLPITKRLIKWLHKQLKQEDDLGRRDAFIEIIQHAYQKEHMARGRSIEFNFNDVYSVSIGKHAWRDNERLRKAVSKRIDRRLEFGNMHQTFLVNKGGKLVPMKRSKMKAIMRQHFETWT